MEIDTAGTLTWLPHASQVGEHVVNVVARRGEAVIEQRFVVTVTP